MKHFGFVTLISIMLFIWAIISGVSAASEQISDNSSLFPFEGTIVYQDLEGGFFGIITEEGEKLLPIDLPDKYTIDGLRISGIATPETGMVSSNMWGEMVSVDDLVPSNDGGETELAWYPTESTGQEVPGDRVFQVLSRIANVLQQRLDIIDERLVDVARKMSDINSTKENQKILLSSLVGNSSGDLAGVYEASILNNAGRITAVYPDIYQASVGTDLTNQPNIASILSYPAPTMSRYMKTIEGKDAVVITYPIISKQKSVSGYISVLVDPSVLADPENIQALKESGYSLMVEQPDGVILSESDKSQVGRSTWDDPIFNTSPSLLASAVHFQNARAGYDNYSGIHGGDVTIAWTTIGLHGTPWRVSISDT